jgi:hypothetical protein
MHGGGQFVRLLDELGISQGRISPCHGTNFPPVNVANGVAVLGVGYVIQRNGFHARSASRHDGFRFAENMQDAAALNPYPHLPVGTQV